MPRRKRNKYATMSKDRAVNLAKPHIDLFESYGGGQYLAWAQQIAKDREMVNNVQLTQEVVSALEDANQIITVNNEMKPARDQVVGRISANSPRWLAAPIDNGDEKLASDFSDLGAYIWRSSNGDMHFRTATENFEDAGMFILAVYYDPYADNGKGDIRLESVDPAVIRIDPRCTWRDAQNSSNIFLGDVLSEDEIKLKFDDFVFDGASEYAGDMRVAGTGSIQEGQVFNASMLPNVKYYRIIDRYQKIKLRMISIKDPNSGFEKILDKNELSSFMDEPAIILTQKGRQHAVVQKDEIMMFQRLQKAYGNIWYEMSDNTIRAGSEDTARAEQTPDNQIIYPVPGSTTMIHPVTMGDLLVEGWIEYRIVPIDRIKRTLIIGEKLYRQMVLPISKYPFGIAMHHHTGTPYCYGDGRLARSAQEQINKIAAIIMAYNINIAALRVFLQKGSFDKKEMERNWGKVGTHFFEYDAELGNVPVIVQLTQMSTAFFEQQDRLRALIERIYGAYPEGEGQAQQVPETLGATMLFRDDIFSRTAAKMKLIENALDTVGEVVSELVPYVYDERKVIQVTRSSKAQAVIFNDQQIDGDIIKVVNDITVNRYRLQTVSGSTLPTNQAVRFNQWLRMWELKAIKDPTPLIRESGLPDIDEVLQTESLINQAQSYIAQLEDTVKGLQGDLQLKTKEKVHADEKAILAKFKADGDALLARMNSAVLLGQQRTNDAVKNFQKQLDDVLTKQADKSEGDAGKGDKNG